jgi:hypothetical protein
MSLVLQSSGGGSVTIAEPTTASNFTVTLPASDGVTMVSGNMPAFGAFANTTTAISAGTRTKITFATELFDTNSNFASSTFTPTVAGYYQINLSFQEANNVSTILQAELYKNGATYATGGYVGTAGTFYIAAVSVIVYMNGSTDYLEGYCFSSASTSVGGGVNSNWFNGSLVRAA